MSNNTTKETERMQNDDYSNEEIWDKAEENVMERTSVHDLLFVAGLQEILREHLDNEIREEYNETVAEADQGA